MHSEHVTALLMIIWSLLIVASAIVYLLIRSHPEKDYQELEQRTKSWWIMLFVLTLALTSSRAVSLIFLGFISFLALKEFFSIIPTRRADHRTLFWVYLAVPIQYYWAGIGWFGMFLIFIPVYMFLLIPFRLLLSKQTDGFLKSAGTIQWGLMITVFALSHLAYLLSLPYLESSHVFGGDLLLYLIFLTQFNDIAQYTCGKLFGKQKIIPTISPKKTWAGFLGGMILTSLLSASIYQLVTPFSLRTAIIAGVLISISGFIGDVTISAIKRDMGIKNTSALIPGHGGILDRVDSLTFSAPLFFHFIYYAYC